eukprot:TRINITY_DN640_c0_g1_i3.p1 TRINITY_DN640_c0_g1~~TRINITY_DN640_c0_g1_i3.p1  ORF type:complete len:206 (-),score=22.35 TRINITY_DN640_c0_g1_i3:17-634(-)
MLVHSDDPAEHFEKISSNTLDEPVYVTIGRDLKRIGLKISKVMLPRQLGGQDLETMRDWDLWGPLVICFALATLLTITAESHNNDGPLIFSLVFVIVCCGSAAVTINTKLLGGKISIFQGGCLIGYSIFPFFVSSIICLILVNAVSWNTILLRIGITCFCVFWASAATASFVGELVPPQRKVLAVYPLFLFYFVVGWIIILVIGE